MRKIFAQTLLALIFSIHISSSMAFATEEKVTEIEALADSQILDLNVDPSTDEGSGQYVVEVLNADGTSAGTKVIDFCKDRLGGVTWDTSCEAAPNLAYSTYDPIRNPEKTNKEMLVALAMLSVIGATKSKNKEEKGEQDSSNNEDSKQKEELEFFGAAALSASANAEHWGDRLRIWDFKFTHWLDKKFDSTVKFLSEHSPLLARKFADGSYLRAMIGQFAILLYPVGIYLGYLAHNDVNGQALPPSFKIFAAIIFLATFDSLAGFLASISFAFGIITSGHFATRSETLTLIGVCVIMFSPALIAASVRPLRRRLNSSNVWERISDYGLIILLGSWTIRNAINSLTTLAHMNLPITKYANEIGYLAASAIFARLILEDLASNFFPKRLYITTPEVAPQKRFSNFVSKLFKLYIFVNITSQFIGWNSKLLIGSFCFILPDLLAILLAGRAPRFKALHWIVPHGTLKIVAMVFIGGLFSSLMNSIFGNSATFLAWSFVVMTIPGLVFNFLGLIKDEPEKDWKERPLGRWVYKIGGVGVFFLLILLVNGVDLFAEFKTIIGM